MSEIKIDEKFLNLPIFPRKFIAAITGNKFKPLNNEFKKLMNKPIHSTQDLIDFYLTYCELYNIVEQKMILTAVPYMNYGGFSAILKIIWYALRVLLRVYGKQKKVYQFIYNNPIFNELPEEYYNLKRLLKTTVEINLKKPLLSMGWEYLQVFLYSSKLGRITVEFEGKKHTLAYMIKYNQDPDRSKREQAWLLINRRMMKESKKFNKLFDRMLKMRNKQAKKLDFTTARDFYHQSKARYDYTPQDIYNFHDSVEKVVVPFVKELNDQRKAKLKIDTLRPWDKEVELNNRVLKPYETTDDLLDKMITVFSKIKPEYGANLQLMKQYHFMDLKNRKGKMSGAFSIPLADSGAAFIHANSVGTQRDVETLAHEGGHAMHSFATKGQNLFYREPPSELAELASMSMEFLIFPYYDQFYSDPGDIKKAKRAALEEVVRFLPWCIIVDAFQQWIYTTPNHTVEQRMQCFKNLVKKFDEAAGVDYSGIEEEQSMRWLRQTHIFQMPFYYIEYGIAQLGALAIYKNYREKGQSAVDAYDQFLKLGYSKPIPEAYQTAGIKFDFSESYLKELMDFIKKEIDSQT
jgi:oligoendopeptidase F